jgi:hypothetical protein
MNVREPAKAGAKFFNSEKEVKKILQDVNPESESISRPENDVMFGSMFNIESTHGTKSLPSSNGNR